MGHVGSKTRSLCQISLNPYSPIRGHSIALIFKELYQNVDVLVVVSWVMLGKKPDH